MNPYEIAITRCKELEQLLEQLGASGRGLFEKAVSVRHLLPPELFRKLRSIAKTRNRLVHESGRWSLGQLETYIQACDWARDEFQRLAPDKFGSPVVRPASAKLTPPVELPLPVKLASPIKQPAPAKSPPPVTPPALVKFSTPAVPTPPPSAPIPVSAPDQRALRGVAYAEAWPAAPVRRIRPRRRTPIIVPLLLLLVVGAAASGDLLQIADAFRDFVDRGIQQAFEQDKARSKPAAPDSQSDDELPEIVPWPY
jgi:hypothetical protein